MRQLYTLAFPELAASDAAFIEAFRREYDSPACDLVSAHFTLVFGTDALSDADYVAHVEQVAKTQEPIEFLCQRATPGDADRENAVLVFLVPTMGFAEISLLHDRLYSGPLTSELRTDLLFAPHITVGATSDRASAISACDALNRWGRRIPGWLREVTVVAVDGRRAETLATFAFGCR